MEAPVDFQSVMAELTVFQNAIGDIHAKLKNKKNKEILGDVLDRLKSARADTEVEYPKAMDLIQSTAQQSKAKAEQALAQIAQKKAAIEQRQAEIQAAQKAVPSKPALSEAKVDPALGQKLRSELLERFGQRTGANQSEASKIREAWQDWD